VSKAASEWRKMRTASSIEDTSKKGKRQALESSAGLMEQRTLAVGRWATLEASVVIHGTMGASSQVNGSTERSAALAFTRGLMADATKDSSPGTRDRGTEYTTCLSLTTKRM
jgi:hypothetical protein